MTRVLWFSPLPPAKTDIANYSRRVVPKLGSLLDVTLVHPEGARPDPDLQSVSIATLSPREINRADLCVYQIGNNPDFHSQILETALAFPGLVVLHDRAVHEFLLIHYGMIERRTVIAQRDAYRVAMTRWYGAAGAEAAQRLGQPGHGPGELANRFPLYEAVLQRALGVVSHNALLTDELRQRLPHLPVLDLPLPYEAPNECPARPQRMVDAPIRLIMFGFMAANRRATEFLHAWSRSGHRERFELHLAGELSDRFRFDATAAELGLADRIRHHGFVEDSVLDTLIRSADFALNLRNPTMGEASGSQLRLWANGCPTAVSEAGWYASLPDASVHKISVDAEQDDLVLLLEDLVRGRLDLARMAERGFQQLRTHDPELYARNLAEWIMQNGAVMRASWTETALIETVAGAYARSLPPHIMPDLPSRLLG